MNVKYIISGKGYSKRISYKASCTRMPKYAIFIDIQAFFLTKMWHSKNVHNLRKKYVVDVVDVYYKFPF